MNGADIPIEGKRSVSYSLAQTHPSLSISPMNVKHLSFFIFISIGGLFFSCQSSDAAKATIEPPNIIFLLTDDQRYDALGAMGNPLIETPEMDRLAAEGILFEHAYVTTPICCTSRASLLSGQYARRHKINDFGTSFSDTAWASCYPSVLKRAGYHLGFIGKFGVGKGPDMPASDFDFWKGIPGQPTYEQQDSAGNYVHLTSILGDQCLEYFEMVPDNRPFCLSVSFKAPHVQDNDPRQFLYDSAYIEKFEQLNIPPPEQEAYIDRFPAFFTENNEARRRWDMRFSTDSLYQASVKGYYRLIYGVDVVIGRIRKALEEQGMADNTVIILMGDNGFFLGEKGLAGKWYVYDESIHVPLIIYDPRLEEGRTGQRIEEMVLNIDVAPTILGLSGAEIPEEMQGEDLSLLYNGSTPAYWREAFLFEHEFVHPRIPMSEGVVSLTEKYVRYLPPSPEHEEYYDLVNDPGEERNLATTEEYSDKVTAMRSRLAGLIEKFK